MAKSVLSVIQVDIQEATGSLQLCSGQISGCEAAIHALNEAYYQDDAEGILLVDASNAFNTLNRAAALRNIQHLCPPLATILINTYRQPSSLFVDGDVLLSREGTTQGDPLAMSMYAVGILPLIHRTYNKVKQAWYADDATAVGKVCDLRAWWDDLVSSGPSFGYFVNASKTSLVVKESQLATATKCFENTNVNITTKGSPHLGAAVGTPAYIKTYVQHKVDQWSVEIKQLSSIAKTQPHAAYAAFVHGLSSKWTYIARTIPDIEECLICLEQVICVHFLPAVMGRAPPNDTERNLLALPCRLGGLGIVNPAKMSNLEYTFSVKVTKPLCAAILEQSDSYSFDTIEAQLIAKAETREAKRHYQSNEASQLIHSLPPSLQYSVKLAQEKGASNWLTTLPVEEFGFALHKGAFRDALALRYGWPPDFAPSLCSCGEPFSVSHALTCKMGGYPAIRHNEIRDLTASLLSEVCHNVSTEPHLQPLEGEPLRGASASVENGARLDVAADGFWGSQFERAFFDVRVFNPHAPSNGHPQPSTCYRKHENEKKRVYEQRI